jgi:hypothetical protein
MTPETTMGYMNQQRQNIRSTTKSKITSYLEDKTVTPAGLGRKLTWCTPESLINDSNTHI